MRLRTSILFSLLLILSISITFAVKIQWFGQSAFCITAQDGTKLITDPYQPGMLVKDKKLNYGAITTKADIVTVSHEHADHNYVKAVPGNPTVIETTIGTFTVKNITIHGVPSYHDKEQGENRGANTIYCFVVDGVKICHLGDLGHTLNPTLIKQIQQTGLVDVLLIPVGGVFTIDADDASKVVEQLKPKIVIPMHYKTDKVEFPLKPVDLFTQGKKGVIVRENSTIEVTVKSLPPERIFDVLQPAL
jgi:L-ascorbate metabolism protein UlaG (beta-lactamase superfamily)